MRMPERIARETYPCCIELICLIPAACLDDLPRIPKTTKDCDMTGSRIALAVAALVFATATCGAGSGAEAKSIQSGGASWYGPGFQGKKTANGERFNTHALTAAHRSLPFGSRVQVTNERTGRSVVVRINDRGPFVGGRVIDLSKAAAQAVGISGVGKVKLTRL